MFISMSNKIIMRNRWHQGGSISYIQNHNSVSCCVFFPPVFPYTVRKRRAFNNTAFYSRCSKSAVCQNSWGKTSTINKAGFQCFLSKISPNKEKIFTNSQAICKIKSQHRWLSKRTLETLAKITSLRLSSFYPCIDNAWG